MSIPLLLCLFSLLIPGHSLAEVPLTKIKSEILEYSAGIYTATGGVVISQESRRLTASTVILNNNTGDVRAYGDVEFIDGNNLLSSDSLMINIRTNYARIDEGKIFIKDDNYHIEGEAIERLSDDRFKIKKGVFTTCDGEPSCWRFKGKDINIRLNHFLTARGVSFEVREVPILYLPYIALPILQERQTGFLIPRIGYNTGEGLKINNAFFWAISDSQDATVYADYYGEKGWGSGLEYRYVLSHDTSGKFNGYYINDIQVNRSRWSIKYNHRQVLSEDLSAKLRINYLNDKPLYKDISENIGERLQRTQDSDLYLNRRWDTLSAHLWAQYTQNLSGNNEGIFQRLPETGFRVMERRVSRLPLYWGLASSASRWEESNTGLTRLHLSPKISARVFEGKGLIFIPEVGTEQTLYYRDGDKDPVHESLYNLAASISTKFYRSFTTGGGHIDHFIEPAIRYEYIEGSTAGTLPLLDIGPHSPPFIRAGDRGNFLKEKNSLSLILISRIISTDSNSRYEPLYLRLTQMYRITSPPIPQWWDEAGVPSGFSDLRLETVARLQKFISIDIDTTYSHRDNSIRSAGADLEFRRDSGHLTVGQRYSKDPSLKFLTASAGIKFYNIDTFIDIWYDNKDHLTRESNYSVRYGSQCWGVTLSYKYKPEEEQFNVLFTLRGAGSVGG